MSGAPAVLALDFDGVLCEGIREYFETSRRASAAVWPGDDVAADALLAPFRTLRPVIETGWEMPVLLRALALGRAPATIAEAWPDTREGVLGADRRRRDDLVAELRRAVDDVRRQWIVADQQGWVGHHATYCDVAVLRRLVAGPHRTCIVTTKEGEFARRLLEHWTLEVDDIQGKEAGSHKCDNLRRLIHGHTSRHGERPALWFVEDRLETLRCVTTHDDLQDVGLFLAAWGYNTAAARVAAQADPRIRLLELARFAEGLPAWKA